MRALSSAQQPIGDGINNDYSENEDSLNVGGDRYQIVNSCLLANGDYQIAKRMYTYQYLHQRHTNMLKYKHWWCIS